MFQSSGAESDGKFSSVRSQVQRRAIEHRFRDPRLSVDREDSIYSDVSRANRRAKRLMDQGRTRRMTAAS